MPGDVFPRESPRSTNSSGEIALYHALKQSLPKGWTAWHSLRLRTRGNWEGEGDFIIADPARGFICLEVKSGNIELRDGHWSQNGRRMDASPRSQAHSFIKHLADEVLRRAGEKPPFGIGCAFPDVEFSDGPETGDLQGLVLGRRQLTWLAEALPALMDKALGGFTARGTKWMVALHSLWGETWVPRVRLLDRIDDAERHLIALDTEQLGVLDAAEHNARAHVQGGAGTGKTILARELCLRQARAGKRVAYFCFTDALAYAVDRSFELALGEGRGATAKPIRRLARSLIGKAPGDDESDPKYWADVSLRAAIDALPPPAERPDLVVVDEAQDLADTDWMLVQALADGRGLWLFGDEHQQFWSDRAIPPSLLEGMTKLKLKRQQRNPPLIAWLAAQYGGQTFEGAAPPRDPSALRVVAVDGDEIDRVRHELGDLRKQGVEEHDLVLLSLAGQTRSKLAGLDKLGSQKLSRADDPDAGKHVVADTFLRFKGLERPCVILTELGEPGLKQYDRRMHIALTRATASVVIVATREAIERDSRLAALT